MCAGRVECEVLQRFLSVDTDSLSSSICEWMDKDVPAFLPDIHPAPQAERTAGCQRVLARFAVSEQQRTQMNLPPNRGESLLNAILHERDGIAVQNLTKHGLSIALPDAESDVAPPVVDSKIHQVVIAFAKMLSRWKNQGIPHERVMHVINCLLVIPMEDEVDALIQRLQNVPYGRREDLAKAFAILVQAPDSPCSKEKVLIDLAGNGAFGYQSADVRQQARALLNATYASDSA